MTINQWIRSNFGDRVTLDGMQHVGEAEFSRAYLPTDADGSLFVLCGGQCMLGFEITPANAPPVLQRRLTAYLVVYPGRWRTDGDTRDQLRLVMSA